MTNLEVLIPSCVGLLGLADHVGNGVSEVLSSAFGAISEHRHFAMPEVRMLCQ